MRVSRGCWPKRKMALTALLTESMLAPDRRGHWTRPGLERLTEAFWDDDPMGFRAFGCPFEEYQPEADMAFALALGCMEVADLWSVEYRRPECFNSDAETMAIINQSFVRMFGQEFDLDLRLVDEFRRAFDLCEDPRAADGHWSRPGVEHLIATSLPRRLCRKGARLAFSLALDCPRVSDLWTREFQKPECLNSDEAITRILDRAYASAMPRDLKAVEDFRDAFYLCEVEVVGAESESSTHKRGSETA